MLKGLAWLFVSFVGERQAQQENQTALPPVMEGDRVRLRSQVELAAEIVAPFWPMRSFIYRNPLQGLEPLPFDEAVRRARTLLGGEGYLPNETYRAFHRRGRITVEEIDAAILKMEPELAGQGRIETASRVISAAEVLRLHLIYSFDRLSPKMAHLLPKGGKARLREDLPLESRKALLGKAGAGAGADGADPEEACAASLWEAVMERLDPPAAFHQTRSNRPAGAGPAGGPEMYRSNGRSGALPARPIRVNGSASAASDERRSDWREALEKDLSDVGKEWTLGVWAGALCGRDLVDEVNNQMIKWCAAFLSEGAAAWPMPHRDRGFYEAWRALAIYDFSGLFINIEGIRDRINRLPAQPEDAIVSHLRRMGIREGHWKAYLERHLAHLPGWTGFIKWRAANRDYPWQKRYPVDLVQYLAVRLFYEAEFLDHLCRENWNIDGTVAEIEAYFLDHLDEYYVRRHSEEIALRDDLAHPTKRDWSGLARRIAQERDRREAQADSVSFRDGWRLFHLFQFLTFSAEEVRSLSRSDLQWLVSLLDAFPPERHRPVWQEAYEAHHRNRLIGLLNGGRKERSGPSVPPSFQAIFCIDAREEALRRHLEARGGETYGFAGFFGVPIRFHPFHSEEELDLCPVLIKPKHDVAEVPRPTQKKVVEKNLSGARWHHIIDGLYHDLKMNLLSPYIIVEVVGGLFGLPFIGKTFFPRLYRKIKGYFRDRLTPPVVTRLEFDLAPAEQAYYVEAALRLMGLTKHFARLVLVCAHGSRSENNPYFAALDCGACGGNHGSPNARIWAAMANRPEVRSLLKERGILIPDETVFIPAEHNTTTDEVLLFDRDDLPPSHRDDLARLVQDLREAGAALRGERCRRLPGAPKEVSSAQAASHVARRSADWSEVRPEWGLSGNAAFIIGRRSLTERIDLEGRAFLHSYDSDQDASGRALEIIMTAPLIVGEWISMEYYFSTVDNLVYGSGTKVVHNVVGRVGVMIGNRSDLQTGLPRQTVMNGEEYYHEPMRLLALIEAPVDRIAAIIARHRVLQQIFDNQWMTLVAVDPATGRFQHYLPGGNWEMILPERSLSAPLIGS